MPSHLAREAEFRARLAEEQVKRWRRRRLLYGLLTPFVGTLIPVASLLLAGSMGSGHVKSWITDGGWMPLLITVMGSVIAAVIARWRGWGIIRGMMIYAGVFIAVLIITRTTMSNVALLPAMLVLMSIFIVSGAAVGYLVLLEEGG
jgi:hypothetical protein